MTAFLSLDGFFIYGTLANDIMRINLSNLDDLAIELNDDNVKTLVDMWYGSELEIRAVAALSPHIFAELCAVTGLSVDDFTDHNVDSDMFCCYSNVFKSQREFEQVLTEKLEPLAEKFAGVNGYDRGYLKNLDAFWSYLIQQRSEIFDGMLDEFIGLLRDDARLLDSLPYADFETLQKAKNLKIFK